jgi:hypothetical protein
VAMKSCADLKSVLADALRKRKGLKAEQRRTCLTSQKKRDIVSCEEDAAAPTLGDILDMFAYDVHSQHDLPLPPVQVQRQRISVQSLHRGITGLRHG